MADAAQSQDTSTTQSNAPATAANSDSSQPEASPTPTTTAATEPQQPDPAAKTAKDFRAQFAVLERQKREMKLEREKLRAEAEQAQAKAKELQAVVDALKSDPADGLTRLGLSFDELAHRVVSGGKPSIESELAATRAEIEALKKARAEDAVQMSKREVEQTLTAFQAEIKTTIDSNPEFELVQAKKAYGDVFEVIETHYRQAGELLTVEQAANLVEKYLEQEGDILLRTTKFRTKLAPKLEPEKPKSPQQQTLTNQLQGAADRTDDDLPFEERKARLKARLERGG